MLVLALIEAAEACSLVPPERFVIDEAEALLDTLPPAVPVVRSARFLRGRPPMVSDDYETCGWVGWSSCDGIGWLEVEFESSDDRTDPTDLGYRLIWLSGVALPAHTHAGEVLVSFEDLQTRGQALETRFQAVAVDRAGNESAPMAEVVVWSPASAPSEPGMCPEVRGSGCAEDGGQLGIGLGLLPLLGTRRRR